MHSLRKYNNNDNNRHFFDRTTSLNLCDSGRDGRAEGSRLSRDVSEFFPELEPYSSVCKDERQRSKMYKDQMLFIYKFKI